MKFMTIITVALVASLAFTGCEKKEPTLGEKLSEAGKSIGKAAEKAADATADAAKKAADAAADAVK